MLPRRSFLKQSAGLALAGLSLRSNSSSARTTQARENEAQIMTVLGPIAPKDMGLTLPHEHVLVDFVGADQVSPNRYDAEEAFRVALPYLEEAGTFGCQTLVECTPAYLGRDPALLKRLSEASGLQLLTNTGFYNAGNGKYLPDFARQESADQLAERWVKEWHEGIEDTEIRPGFIKIGMDRGPLSEESRKLVVASARTHKQTGLTIAAHTGDGEAALEELEILVKEGIDPSAWIWVHAQNERDANLHRQAADQGGWISLDGIGPKSIDRHLEAVLALKDSGHLGRILLSHDAGWYRVGEPGGGNYRSYDTLFKAFLPRLKAAGMTEKELQQILVLNPAKAFTVRIRLK